MKEYRWKNPYIELQNSLPDQLISGDDLELTEQQIDQVKARCQQAGKVACELGCGSGGYLLQIAKAYPDMLFLGFEIRYKRAYKAAEKAARAGLSNVVIVRAVAQTLPKLFPIQSLDGLFVNFPDPWAKKKWKKHRLLNPTFIAELASLLKPDGFLSYKTDHSSYFAETVDLLNSSPAWELAVTTLDLHKTTEPARLQRTEFENLFISKGLPICYLLAKKLPEAKINHL